MNESERSNTNLEPISGSRIRLPEKVQVNVVHENMRNPFREKARSVGENEAFVHLVRAAQEDISFRATLCAMLRQPSFHRKSMLNTMVTAMCAAGEREDVIRAVSALTDDAVAERTLELLEG